MPDRVEIEKADNCFCGTATVGERGQVVIPADLRKELGMQPGDKLLIWKHPSGKGIMLFPVDSVREFMTMMLATLERAETHEIEPSHSDDPPPTS
jgi:AbrB family looped-hinge helix DNA binding protein